MSKIGLRPYLLQVYDKVNHNLVPFKATGFGSELHSFVPVFEQAFAQGKANRTDSRSLYLAPRQISGRSFHGLMHYGSFGVDSIIEDGTTGNELLKRKAGDVEIFPLYYRFWVPDSGKSSLALFQSYENRSCAQQALTLFRDFFEFQNPNLRLIAQKLMPQPKAVAKLPTKKLKFYQKRVDPDSILNLDLGTTEPVHVELIIHAMKNRNLGKFEFYQKSVADGLLALDGIEFEQVSAEVKIGNETRTVGLLNVSSKAGVVDVSADLELKDGHPTFDSIAEQAKNLILDLRREYGIS